MNKKQRGLNPGDSRHGTVHGYENCGCRCEPCRMAMRERAAYRKAQGLAPDDARHGTITGYQRWGCRCEPCSWANAKRARRRKYGFNDDMELIYAATTHCSICSQKMDFVKPSGGKGKIVPKGKVVDHCHETGRVRGIICNRCNKMLGFAEDNPAILIAAAEYLKNGGMFNE